MRNLLILLSVFAIAIATSAFAAKNPTTIEEDLSTPEGLMRLVPQLKNADGKFEIPNPKTDLNKFLTVHQSLTNIIEAALVKASENADLYSISSMPQTSLSFGQKWRGAEIGVKTDGTTISFPNNKKFAAYGGESFMTDLAPVAETQGSFYQVNKPDGSIPAIISAQSTLLPCVNRLVLAAADTTGTWMHPSYALGTKDGKAFLVVNKCIDMGLATNQDGKNQLLANAELFTAIQWADLPEFAHMKSNDRMPSASC